MRLVLAVVVVVAVHVVNLAEGQGQCVFFKFFQPLYWRYYISTFYLDSLDSKIACERFGGTIVLIRNQRQLDAIIDELESQGAYDGQRVHIGGLRVRGRWTYRDFPTEPMYQVWHQGEPGRDTQEMCAILERRNSVFAMAASPCQFVHARYICQKEPI